MSEKLVVATSVTKAFPDGREYRQVLDNVDLGVSKGQIVGVQGPSGSGKTTLLSIVGGLLSHDSGHIEVAGQRLDYSKPGEIAKLRKQHIGLISQTYGLIETETVIANITLPLMFDRPRPSRTAKADTVKRAMEWAALDVKAKAKVANLSEGEKQRVAIARALVRIPTLLIADEPTAALDAQTGGRIARLLRSVAEHGVAVLVATHDQQVAEICDTVYRFDRGSLDAPRLQE